MPISQNSTPQAWIRRGLLCAALMPMAILGPGEGANAQETFPSKNISLLVAYPPGGGADRLARLLAQGLSERLGRQVVVENKPGGSGAVVFGELRQRNADSHTLAIATEAGVTVMPLTTKGLGYDALKDFVLLSQVTEVPLLIAAPPGGTIGDASALFKAGHDRPGAVNMGIISLANQIAFQELKAISSVDFNLVTYRGEADVAIALMGNQLDAGLLTLAGARPLVQAGKLVPLAVTGRSRLPSMPDVPRVSEFAPGLDLRAWIGVFVRAGAPPTHLERLEKELATVVRTYGPLIEFFRSNDYPVIGIGSSEATAVWRADYDSTARSLNKLGIKPQ